jgi:TIR domain
MSVEGGVFISYRREEASGIAGRIYDRIADRFGQRRIFMDVDSIEPGLDFTEVITRAVGACDVLLAVIGLQWLTATDSQGRRRLDDSDDLVRLELEAALARDIRVIPILVDGAQMPGRADLPDSLAPLTRRNALPLRNETFRIDIRRLEDVLEPLVGATPTPSGTDSDQNYRPAQPVGSAEETRNHSAPQPDQEILGSDPAFADAATAGQIPVDATVPSAAMAESILPTDGAVGTSTVGGGRWRRPLMAAALAVVVIAGLVTAIVMLSGKDADRPSAPASAAASASALASATSTVQVSSTEPWTDTGVDCGPGEVLDISATGTVLHNKDSADSTVSPDGLADPGYRQYNVAGLPDANTVALIGSFDRDQPFFVVGSAKTITCPAVGRLFLGVNDTGLVGLGGNSGEFSATITRHPA